MNVNIQALHFNATEQLEEFIGKKVDKLTKHAGECENVEVVLKVTKPESANNKEVSISMKFPGCELRANKIADTFEESVDLCVDVLRRQIEKFKEKHANH